MIALNHEKLIQKLLLYYRKQQVWHAHIMHETSSWSSSSAGSQPLVVEEDSLSRTLLQLGFKISNSNLDANQERTFATHQCNTRPSLMPSASKGWQHSLCCFMNSNGGRLKDKRLITAHAKCGVPIIVHAKM